MIVALSLVSVLILGLAPNAVAAPLAVLVLLGTAHVWGFLAVFPLVRRLRRRW
ncbi:MAG: hypothetical protein KBB39_12505 [Phycicoccus sp.]|nr:hypothetical protein [Phycicoccus sp.]